MDILKHIGRGSFSDVFLCKNETNSQVLGDTCDNFFVVKKIDVMYLVKKHVKAGPFRKRCNLTRRIDHTASLSITPCDDDQNYADYSEGEYFYNKFKELVESEIMVLDYMNHCNITSYLSCSVLQDVYSIEMEYCNRGDLFTILKDNPAEFRKHRTSFNGFDNTFVLTFLTDVVNAINYLDDNAIIHRDIKLHNILVHALEENDECDFPYVFKISDFGFACEDISQNSQTYFDSDVLKKKYYKVCGTPYYMAPEILLNCEKIESSEDNNQGIHFYNTKSDLWSLGVCLSELIFTNLPFTSVNSVSDLKIFFSKKSSQRVLHKRIYSNKHISNQLKFILNKLLTINPANRCSAKYLYNYMNNLSDKVLHVKLSDKIPQVTLERNINLDSWEFISCDTNTNCEVQINDTCGGSSWNKIDTSGSLILKMSLTRPFAEWLIQKR